MFFRRKKKEPEAPPKPLSGSVTLAGHSWDVREEKRQGPRPQLLVLTDTTEPDSHMHVRPPEGSPARSMEEVEALAGDPLYRWFSHQGRRWEARMVLGSDGDGPDRRLVKFISGREVFEGDYPHHNGLGHRNTAELIALLDDLKS